MWFIQSKKSLLQSYEDMFLLEQKIAIESRELELKRRSSMKKVEFRVGDSNPMPKLEAGMVVEQGWADSDRTSKFLVVGNTLLCLSGDSYSTVDFSSEGWETIRIWKPTIYSFDSIEGCLKDPIWECTPKKTEKELKLEELRKKYEELGNAIKEVEKS